MYRLTYINFYDQKTVGFYNTIEEVNFYIKAHGLFSGEMVIKELKIDFLTKEQCDELEA